MIPENKIKMDKCREIESINIKNGVYRTHTVSYNDDLSYEVVITKVKPTA